MTNSLRTSRRGFMTGAASVAVAGATTPSVFASTPSFDTLKRDNLQDHVNSTFTMNNALGETLPARLVRVEKLATHGRRPLSVRQDSYAAIFKMSGLSSDSQDQILTINHPKLGKMDAYVQPIHSVTGPITEVEVIFS